MNESLTAGFLGRKAGADTRIRVHRDMGFQFGGEVVVSTAAAEEAQQAKTESSEFSHSVLRFAGASKEASQDRGGLFPLGSGFLHLSLARLGQFVELCFAVILREAPS